MLLATLGLVAWMLPAHAIGLASPAPPAGWALLAAALLLFPASEAVVALINRLISESVRPRHLPRLALADGIPPEHRVLVVIPAMLTDAAAVAELVHRLQLHYLANPEPQAQFALLTRLGRRRQRAHRQPTLPCSAWPVARSRALNARYPRRRAGTGRAALPAAAPRAPVQRDRAALDRLGAQARQARAAGGGAGRRGDAGGLPRPGRSSRIAADTPLRA